MSDTNKQPIKLNLGCGDRKIHGFINIDARDDIAPDVVCDISHISEQFKNVDLIYACHVLEHFPKKSSHFYQTSYMELLKDWYDTLKSGGILRLAIPDFDAVVDYYHQAGSLDDLYCMIYGGQKYDFDFHFHCWNFKSLCEDLTQIGFKEIRKYDWRKTEHSYVDDYSQAYLPHMDKIKGRLMSLNVEATK